MPKYKPVAKKLAKAVAYLILVPAIIIMLILLNHVLDDGKPDPQPAEPQIVMRADQRDANIMAATLCEERVRSSLKAPRTAKFPWRKETSFNGRTAILSSFVDAENAFGAMIRTRYVCTVEYTGGKAGDFDNWRITDFALIE